MADQTSTIPKGWKMTTLGEVAEVNGSTIDKNFTFDEIEYIDDSKEEIDLSRVCCYKIL